MLHVKVIVYGSITTAIYTYITRILQFQIDEFSPLFSDVHSALHVHESNNKHVPDDHQSMLEAESELNVMTLWDSHEIMG